MGVGSKRDKHILILGAQVPFMRGGAEILCESLTDAVNRYLNGVTAELVNLPFKWYPEIQILRDMAAWRLVDLTESDGRKIDMVIPTKFPTYVVAHENKVPWLVHQHRVFYDLEGSEYDVPHTPEIDREVRRKVRDSDSQFLGECRRRYSISNTVSKRLEEFNNLTSTPLLPPPKLGEQISNTGYGDFILYVGRIEKIKRIDLLLEALTYSKQAKAVVVGAGKQLKELKQRAAKLQVSDRCEFTGYISDPEYLELLGSCRAVYYGPRDEDYGYATVEAFKAGKPVLTVSGSGEVEALVESTGAGWVTEADGGSLADAVARVYSLSSEKLRGVAAPGYELAATITWENVLGELIEANL
jgi:glycosyltransferase involved in cell wall biosynthesis